MNELLHYPLDCGALKIENQQLSLVKTGGSDLVDVVKFIASQNLPLRDRNFFFHNLVKLKENLIKIKGMTNQHNNSKMLAVTRIAGLVFTIKESSKVIDTTDLENKIDVLRQEEVRMLKEELDTLNTQTGVITKRQWKAVRDNFELMSAETHNLFLEHKKQFLDAKGDLVHPEESLYVSYAKVMKRGFLQSKIKEMNLYEDQSHQIRVYFCGHDLLAHRLVPAINYTAQEREQRCVVADELAKEFEKFFM